MLKYSMKISRADSHMRIWSFPTFREINPSPSSGCGLIAPPTHNEDGDGVLGKSGNLHILMWLPAREIIIEFCRHENFKICLKSIVQPRTIHEGTEEEWNYSSTVSLNLAPDGVSVQRHASVAFRLGRRAGTHCTRNWAGPRDSLDGSWKSLTHPNCIPGPSRR